MITRGLPRNTSTRTYRLFYKASMARRSMRITEPADRKLRSCCREVPNSLTGPIGHGSRGGVRCR